MDRDKYTNLLHEDFGGTAVVSNNHATERLLFNMFSD